ncbi:MAG: UvrD-helicase domain-containing protein [Clostridia bacterium]|nr:UvrD-helicase domain-containing protein [Clostridia bacterium]
MSSKLELTPAQKVAVNLRGHTMLVSAAAGSGKTAVLTKRIIELVTDSENPIDVSEILVVTFTKAAATELKERISKAVFSALKEDPTNKHLSNQLLNLGKAKICTIHSFCADLVKNNFQNLDLPANLRIADESESALICNNIMNELIDSCYGGLYSEKISDFADFTENFLQAKKDNSLPMIFTGIYNYLRNFPIGISLLNNCADELRCGSKTNPLETKWGKKITDYLKRTFEYYYKELDSACDYFIADEKFARSYLPAFEEDRRICYDIVSSVEGSAYSGLVDIFNGNNKLKLGNIKSEYQTDESNYYKAIRAEFWDKLSKAASNYFAFSEDVVRTHFEHTSVVCRDMYAFLSAFDGMYKEEKKSRGLLDYNDLENFALRLLYVDKECTVSSELASSIKEKYKYIFIDEYQDVNELQDKIFLGISTTVNRFMVGDIKQSIYGFRGSEPALFSEYRSAFPEVSPERKCPNSDGVTLYLSNNFRSDKAVIDFSNAVFEVLFNNNSGKTPYTEGDRLVCSKVYKDGEKDCKVRLCFMEDDDDVAGVVREAEFVASEIEKLVKKGTDPSDIALLFRSRNSTLYFEEALKKRNISSFNQVNRDFFENDAVLLMLCILNTVDNPSRDIYLAGALKSPIFSFSLSELTKIRRYENSGTLFYALQKYYDDTSDKKCEYFLNKLNQWRKYAEGCPVDKLVRHIYNDTHIVELLSGRKNNDSDIERQANLLLLYEYARQFENGSFKGLYNFILYLNDVLDKKTRLSNARLTGDGKGVVNIMSVHNSKGLEFDTVFICDTSHRFNRDDERSSYIIHKDFGLTLKLRDETTFGKFNTLSRSAAEIALREEALDEEMRVLYVALTRAKKRLIITSALKHARDVIESISSPERKVSRHILLEARSMSELILWGIIKSDYRDYEIEYVSNRIEEKNTIIEKTEKVYDEKLVDDILSQVEKRLSFEYPYKEMTELPSKLAVSKLYPAVLDEYTTETEPIAPAMYVKPKFLLPEQERATGAERGTATHLFMQFCDFNNVTINGVENELERLTEKGYIDKRNSSLVNIERIKEFFKGQLFNSLLSAKRVWRERRFNIKLSATDFTRNPELKEKYADESILVQGVIDLLFVDENDKLVLADYKSDWFSDKDISTGNAEKILIERHKTQLSYYAEACERMFGKKVDKILIYSFALGKTVEI